MLTVSGDVYRPAAIEQLKTVTQQVGAEWFASAPDQKPVDIARAALDYARKHYIDVLLVDTAGRLHNKKNLMDELSKISRVVHKACGTASVETLLVLDAITGQNAISQASQFIDAAGATGIVLTKLDGTAKGGAVISIKAKLGLPVRFVGVGEGMDDLMEFDPDAFVDALFLREE